MRELSTVCVPEVLSKYLAFFLGGVIIGGKLKFL